MANADSSYVRDQQQKADKAAAEGNHDLASHYIANIGIAYDHDGNAPKAIEYAERASITADSEKYQKQYGNRAQFLRDEASGSK